MIHSKQVLAMNLMKEVLSITPAKVVFGSVSVRADLSSHLRYSQCWSGVCAGVLLGVQGAVHRGER